MTRASEDFGAEKRRHGKPADGASARRTSGSGSGCCMAGTPDAQSSVFGIADPLSYTRPHDRR